MYHIVFDQVLDLSLSFKDRQEQFVKVECVCVCVCVCSTSQSCPTLYDPMESSPPHSSVYGIFQARYSDCNICTMIRQEYSLSLVDMSSNIWVEAL